MKERKKEEKMQRRSLGEDALFPTDSVLRLRGQREGEEREGRVERARGESEEGMKSSDGGRI